MLLLFKVAPLTLYRCSYSGLDIFGHSRKQPHLPPRRKLEVNPPTPFGCPNTITIIRNNFLSPPLRTAEISSVRGVWTFSGMTHYANLYIVLFLPNIIFSLKKNKISVDVHIIIFVLYAMIFACRLLETRK